MVRRLSGYEKAEIEVLWRNGVRLRRIVELTGFSESTVMKTGRGLPRPPCECGRAAGHKGHCLHRNTAALESMKASRSTWNAEADEVVVRRYPKGDGLHAIADEVSKILGYEVTPVAVQSRAQRLRLSRPDDYQRELRRALVTGRKKGTPNKRPYIRRNEIARDPTTGRYTLKTSALDMWIVAREPDAAYEHLINMDRQSEELALVRQERLMAVARSRAVQRDDKQARLKEAGIAKRLIETARRAPPARPVANDAAVRETITVKRLDMFSFVKQDVPNTVPTARADPAKKGTPYRMSAMSGPDPMRDARLRQIAEASKGRI